VIGSLPFADVTPLRILASAARLKFPQVHVASTQGIRVFFEFEETVQLHWMKIREARQIRISA